MWLALANGVWTEVAAYHFTIQSFRDLTTCTILSRTEEIAEQTQRNRRDHSLKQKPQTKPQLEKLSCNQPAGVWTISDCWSPWVWGSNWYRPTFTLIIKNSCPCSFLSWSRILFNGPEPHSPQAHAHGWCRLKLCNRNLAHLPNFRTFPF